MSDKYFDLPEGIPDGTYTSRDGRATITISTLSDAEIEKLNSDDVEAVEISFTGEETPEEMEAKAAAACEAAGVAPGKHVRIVLRSVAKT